MIESRYYGSTLASIADPAFRSGFDPDGRWPALVLASIFTVPDGVQDSWQLAVESCGGYSCDERKAAVLPLSIRPEKQGFLTNIADENFSPEPLDYLGMNAGNNDAVRHGYLACLHAAGLSCSQENLGLLTQALYPVDATPGNLSILSGDHVDLSLFQDRHGLVIFIVGQNCD